MIAKSVIPVLNVSDFDQSLAWFEKLGWKKAWDWGTPPTFGCVTSGECGIFLCLDGQGGRGKSNLATTFGNEAAEAADNGVWICIMVDDVDAIHRHCLEQEIEITWPPTDTSLQYLTTSPRRLASCQGKCTGEMEHDSVPVPAAQIERVASDTTAV